MSRRRVKYGAEQAKPEAFSDCYVCGRWVGSSGERDHFPAPYSLGGREVLPICQPCHDLKDRITLDGWRPGEAFVQFAGLWSKADHRERLMLVKMFHIASQSVATVEELVMKVGKPEIPYGMRRDDDGMLVPDDGEQAVIAACRVLKSEGWTMAEIAAELEKRGLMARGER